MIERQELPKLLDGPLCSRMVGDIVVQDPARTNLHCNKDVHNSKGCGYGDKEVTGDNYLRMVSDERAPALIPRSASRPISFEVFANRARRDANTQLQQELVCNLLLAPDGVLAAYLPNQLAQILRQSWTSALPGLPAPERSEPGSMPFYESCRLDDHKRATPIKELSQDNHHEPERGGRSLRSDLAFLEQRELLSKE